MTFAIDNNGMSYCAWESLHPFLKQFVTEDMREHIVCNCNANCGEIYEVVTMANVMKAIDAMKADKIKRSN